jgi:methanogenic corrinoid protein MtbC1
MITVAERKEIAKLVLTTHDNKVIEKIKALIFTGTKSKESLIKKYNKEIDEAVEQIRKGKYFTQQEADELLARWEKE